MNWNFKLTGWSSGCGGFGFGLWRANYNPTIFWTLAIGPFTVYAIKNNPTLHTNEEKVNVIQ